MADMWRVTVAWSGGKIGSGFSNLFFDGGGSDPQAAADAVAAFFKTAYGNGVNLPNGVTLTFPSVVTDINEVTGQMGGQVGVTASSPLTGGDASSYAALAGACVTWITNGFYNGRRLRGRTFLVPCGGNGLQSDGTLSSNFRTACQTAAAALIGASVDLMVWRRPTNQTAADGAKDPVIGSQVTDKAAFLTSRR